MATSHPLATRAGVRALEAGGNAVDAALAAAAMLTVCEPPHNGVGGDAFAQLWFDGELYGLNGSGRAPAHIDGRPSTPRARARSRCPARCARGPTLAERFGRLGLDAALRRRDRRGAQRRGGHRADRRALARGAGAGAVAGAAPRPSATACPTSPATLRGDRRGRARRDLPGPIAAAIAAASWLSEDDLAAHRSEWVTPLRRAYRGVEVCELPPNTQGAAALVALGIAEELDGDLHGDVEAAKLALDWAARTHRRRPRRPARRRRAAARGSAASRGRHAVWPGGGTTYLCAVDGERNAVSWIQSIFEGFGSGVRWATRGSRCTTAARASPRRRATPTGSPRGGARSTRSSRGCCCATGPAGPFGVMGGSMQAQAHFQLVRHVVDGGLDPQAALDAARFRVLGGAASSSSRASPRRPRPARARTRRARGRRAARLRRGPDDPRRRRRARRRVGRSRRRARRRAVTERVLTARELNRALLARQLLLERASLSIPRALERMGGLQAQYAPSMYIGLWSRLEGFERDALTRALERRSVVQGTLMRSTIHLVSRARLLAAGARRRAPAARLVAEGQPRRPRRARHERRGAQAAPAARRGTLRRGEIEDAGGQAPRPAGDRPLAAPGARPAVGDVGAPPRGPLRAGRGLARRRPRWTTTKPSTTPCGATSAASARPRSPRSPTGRAFPPARWRPR